MTDKVETAKTIEYSDIDADVEIDNVRVKSIIFSPAVASDSVVIVDNSEPSKQPVKFPLADGGNVLPQIVYVEQRLSLLIDHSASTLNTASKVIINKGK